MASKRKLEEKKKRAAMRQDKFQHERAEQVACRLLGKTTASPKRIMSCGGSGQANAPST